MGQTLTTTCTISCGNVVGQQLASAIGEGDVDMVQQMIDADPKRLNNGLFYDRQTPLHVAARHGQLQVLFMLLERGAQPNGLNRNRQTPLMLACKTGQSTCIEPLLKAGANILGFDSTYGRTCLHYASRGGHMDCVRKILEAARLGPVSQSWGVARFVNVRDCRGMSALHMASRAGHSSVLRLLLDNGALVSTTATTTGNGPFQGSSPIHYAARGGSLDCVRELLAWGADRNQRDLTGQTAFVIAMKYSNTACAALLNPHAAEPLVWPSPWKFMSEGELEPEAKTVLEAALAQANDELDKEIAAQTKREAVRKSSSRRKRSTFSSYLMTPEQLVMASPTVDSPGAETAMPAETSIEEARMSTVGDLPSTNSDAIDTGGMGVQEMCCICYEQFCTIEVMECGHQMCATCTLSLCCHSKPNPAIPYSPAPSCPFCRHSIGHLILARPKPKLPDTKEKPRRKLRRSGGSKGNSKGGSITGSILSALGGSKRLGSSGRVADVDWLERSGSQNLEASFRIANADFLDRSGSSLTGSMFNALGGSKRLGSSGRLADALGGNKRLGSSGRVADADWLERCGSISFETSGRIANTDFLDRCGSVKLGASSTMVDPAR